MLFEAVVPVAFFAPHHIAMTHDFLHALSREPDISRIVIYYNGGPLEGEWDHQAILAEQIPLIRRDAQDWKFYRMWNDAIARAQSDIVLVLNNDIVWEPGALAKLGHSLRLSQDRVVAASHDGSLRFAFAIRRNYRHALGHNLPEIDERYNIYCGDYELMANIRRAGLHTIAVPVEITNRSATVRYVDDALIAADRKLFAEKH